MNNVFLDNILQSLWRSVFGNKAEIVRGIYKQAYNYDKTILKLHQAILLSIETGLSAERQITSLNQVPLGFPNVSVVEAIVVLIQARKVRIQLEVVRAKEAEIVELANKARKELQQLVLSIKILVGRGAGNELEDMVAKLEQPLNEIIEPLQPQTQLQEPQVITTNQLQWSPHKKINLSEIIVVWIRNHLGDDELEETQYWDTISKQQVILALVKSASFIMVIPISITMAFAYQYSLSHTDEESITMNNILLYSVLALLTFVTTPLISEAHTICNIVDIIQEVVKKSQEHQPLATNIQQPVAEQAAGENTQQVY